MKTFFAFICVNVVGYHILDCSLNLILVYLGNRNVKTLNPKRWTILCVKVKRNFVNISVCLYVGEGFLLANRLPTYDINWTLVPSL